MEFQSSWELHSLHPQLTDLFFFFLLIAGSSSAPSSSSSMMWGLKTAAWQDQGYLSFSFLILSELTWAIGPVKQAHYSYIYKYYQTQGQFGDSPGHTQP